MRLLTLSVPLFFLSLMLVLLLAVFLIFATHDGFFLHHSHTEILIFTRIQIKLQSGRGSGLTGIVTGYGSGSLAGSRKTESSSLAS